MGDNYMKKIYNSKYFKNFILFVFLILTLLSFFSDVNLNYNNKTTFIIGLNANNLTIFVMGLLLYPLYKNFYFKNTSNLYFKLLAFVFSLFMIFGNSYSKMNSWDLIFGSFSVLLVAIFQLIGFFIFFNWAINYIYQFIIKKNLFKSNKSKGGLKGIIEKHPFISSLIIILICWLPYIIAFYPAILSPDPSNQIQQFFGMETHYIESVVLIDENVVITNHHPFFHTVLLGGCVKIGHMLGSDNLGLFLYSIIQITIFLSTLAFTIFYMKKLKVSTNFQIISLTIYALIPVFPLYAMSAVKDVIFTSLVILYIIMLFEFIKNANQKIYTYKVILISCLLLLLIMLIRNNGIHMILLSFPFLFLIDKKNLLKLGIIFIVPIIVYQSYSNILLPALKISPGSIREMLSIPFQQTARYVTEYESEISDKDKEIIDKILVYNTLKERYNPVHADAVKNEFNRYATKEDLKNYFSVWYQGFLNHPDVYIESVLNNTFGYFYPNTNNWYIYYKYDKRLQETGEFNYKYNGLKDLRSGLAAYGVAFPKIPVFGMIVNIGFNVWLIMLMFTFLLRLKKYRYLILLTPVIALILICIASPVNTYFRYAMPYVFAMPLLIAIFLKIVYNSKREEKEVYIDEK